MNGIIEGCVDSYASCAAAAKGGADRFELCAHLEIGGATPSHILFEQVKRDFGVKINVLIRPRFGDFLYSEQETEEICGEIEYFREHGANGVVVGALTPEGDLDQSKMRRFVSLAGDMEVTLHRAFDMTRDPFETMERAIALGCKTILTSGQESDVTLGIPLLKELRRRAEGRIDIMAGCGVKKWNIAEIARETGITTFHTTGRKAPAQSGMKYRKSSVHMGLPSFSEYELPVTDEEEFRECAKIVHSL